MLTNSPSVFQKYICHVFQQLLKDGVIILFMDYLIIISCNERESIDKLKHILKTASKPWFGLQLWEMPIP